jgi:hypothetical protein
MHYNFYKWMHYSKLMIIFGTEPLYFLTGYYILPPCFQHNGLSRLQPGFGHSSAWVWVLNTTRLFILVFVPLLFQ